MFVDVKSKMGSESPGRYLKMLQNETISGHMPITEELVSRNLVLGQSSWRDGMT